MLRKVATNIRPTGLTNVLLALAASVSQGNAEVVCLSRAAGNVSQEELEKIMREVDTSMHNDKGKRKKKRSGAGYFEVRFFRKKKNIRRDRGVSWERNPLDKSEQRPRKLQL